MAQYEKNFLQKFNARKTFDERSIICHNVVFGSFEETLAMSYANFSNILDPEILLDKGIVSKWGEPNADEEVDEEVANEAKIDDTRQTDWHHEVPPEPRQESLTRQSNQCECGSFDQSKSMVKLVRVEKMVWYGISTRKIAWNMLIHNI